MNKAIKFKKTSSSQKELEVFYYIKLFFQRFNQTLCHRI